MRPTQCVTQCVTIRKCLIEKPHIPEVRNVKSLPKLMGQAIRETRQQFCSVLCTIRTFLFEPNDVAAHLPASAHLNDIHRAKGLLPGVLDEDAQLPQQIAKF